MNPSHGYDFELVSDIGKDFECPICLLLLRDAVELPCLHVFCKECLDNWQGNAMEKDVELLCPSCKKTYQKDKINKNKYVDKLITTSFKVKCKENKFGCEWIGTILDYKDHEKECTYKSIICDHPGCDKKILKINQQQHQSECVYRLVQCQHCMLRVQLINIENHLNSCEEYIIPCPNKDCPITIPRKQMLDHTSRDCPHQYIHCQYLMVGCNDMFARKHIHHHEAENTVKHMNMLLRNFTLTSAELSMVKSKLETTEQSLKETEEKLVETNEKLERVIVALNKNEENLRESNEKCVQANNWIEKTAQELMKIDEKHLEAEKNIHVKVDSLNEHNNQIDDLCIQLTKLGYMYSSKFINSIEVLLSSLSLTSTREYSDEFDRKYEEVKNFPEMFKELTVLLVDRMQVMPDSYEDRLDTAMDIMKENKLYKINEYEFYVKISVKNHRDLLFIVFFENMNTKDRLKSMVGTFFHSEELILLTYNGELQIVFYLPTWHSNKATVYIKQPTGNDIEINAAKAYSNNGMTVKNNLLLKCILRI